MTDVCEKSCGVPFTADKSHDGSPSCITPHAINWPLRAGVVQTYECAQAGTHSVRAGGRSTAGTLPPPRAMRLWWHL